MRRLFDKYFSYNDIDYLVEHYTNFVFKMCRKMTKRYKKKYTYFGVLKMIEELMKKD